MSRSTAARWLCRRGRFLQPDVLSLNEYVHGDSRVELLTELTSAGLRHVLISNRLNGNNQVLVASRFPLAAGELQGPQSRDQGGESNFLHVRVPSHDLEFVGLRAPAYSSEDLRVYWDGLMEIMRGCAKRRIVFMGDFNADPDQQRRSTGKHLRSLREEGWHIPSPAGEWSYISTRAAGTRIDHIVTSQHLRVERAEYVSKIESLELASPNKMARVSDQAPLVAQLGQLA